MSDLFASGGAVDIVLLVIAAEFVVLTWRGADKRAAAVEAFFALGAGACLLLALRAALVGAPWFEIALWVTASFPIHLGDLARRARRRD
jgi:hypothetical protein